MFFSMRSFVFLQYFFINWSSTCQLSYEGSMLSISGIMPLTSPCWTTWHSLSNSFHQRILFLSYFALTCFNLDIFPYCLTAIHTFFSEAVVIPEICLWLSFPCHVWSHPTFPASCFYPPPQSPALLALLSSCPASPGVAASASEGQPSLFLEDKAYLLSSQTVGLGDQGLVQPQGIQAVHCFTARTSGEAERRHSMCEFASTTLESTSPDSQDPAYSENFQNHFYITVGFLLTLFVYRGIQRQKLYPSSKSVWERRENPQAGLTNNRQSNFGKGRKSLFSISQFKVVPFPQCVTLYTWIASFCKTPWCTSSVYLICHYGSLAEAVQQFCMSSVIFCISLLLCPSVYFPLEQLRPQGNSSTNCAREAEAMSLPLLPMCYPVMNTSWEISACY